MLASTDSNVFNITIPPEEWRPCGITNFQAALRMRLAINGVMFHVYAYAVKRDLDELALVAVEKDWQEEVDHVVGLCSDVGWPATQMIEIDGVTHEYLIVSYPYGD